MITQENLREFAGRRVKAVTEDGEWTGTIIGQRLPNFSVIVAPDAEFTDGSERTWIGWDIDELDALFLERYRVEFRKGMWVHLHQMTLI